MNLVRREFEADGIPLTAWGLLVHVEFHGRTTPSQLAAETGVTATTVGDRGRSLVDRGALRRVPNRQDTRSYLLELTALGKRDLKRGRAAIARAEAAVEASLGRPLDDVFDTMIEV